jgi:hypothetical protein
MHCRGRGDQFFAAHVLTLLPCRISAKGRIEFKDAIVVFDRPQFVFFAQFDRHQPRSPPEFGAMSADARDELGNIGATVVLLNEFGTVRVISAEGSHIRSFSSIEITPLNVRGKGERRQLYVAQADMLLFRGVFPAGTIDRRQTTMGKFLERDSDGQCGVALGMNTLGGAACRVAFANDRIASQVDSRAEDSSGQAYS